MDLLEKHYKNKKDKDKKKKKKGGWMDEPLRQMGILDHIDRFLNETVTANDFPKDMQYPLQQNKYTGEKAIQFMRWWGAFRPGDRVNVTFDDDTIYLYGTNSEGQFAGIKKEMLLDNMDDIEAFKQDEGYYWNFV